MGFGTLFATVACFIIMAAGAFLFTTNILYTAEVVSSSLDASSDLQYARLKTGIDIESASVLADDRINVSINNTGSMKILDSDFKYMDVYVRYTKSTKKINRIPYDVTNPPLANNWTNMGISPDSINPGIFDPDEYFNITIVIPPGSVTTTPPTDNYIKIVTPNGVWATKTGF